MSEKGSPQASQVNKSELWATFTDYDNDYAPYDGRVIRFRLSGDVLFVYIGTLKEGEGQNVGTETFVFEDDQSLGIDAEALYETLASMLRRSDRRARDQLHEGTIQADDPRLTTVPHLIHGPAARRRA